MNLLKKFGDAQVSIAQRASQDEYQEGIYHKSSTVGSMANMYGLFLMGAILAWVLPSGYAFYSFLILIPAFFTVIASYGCMKHYAPRPKANVELKYMWPIFALLIIQMIGVKISKDASIEPSQILLGTIPATIGGVIGVAIAVGAMTALRSKDENRFDREADEDDYEDD